MIRYRVVRALGSRGCPLKLSACPRLGDGQVDAANDICQIEGIDDGISELPVINDVIRDAVVHHRGQLIGLREHIPFSGLKQNDRLIFVSELKFSGG